MKFKYNTATIFYVLLMILAANLSASARPGDLDKTFGAGGIAANGLSTLDAIIGDTALQPDGKIVIVTYGAYVVRCNPDGSLDTTFGTNGVTQMTFQLINAAHITNHLSAVAIQPDGKIIVAGYNETNDIGYYYGDAVLARLNTNGTLDATFGTGGKVYTHTGAGGGNGGTTIYSLQIGSDGSIYASGGNGDRDTTGVLFRPAAILKLSSNGAILAAVYPSYVGDYSLRRFFGISALQPDGKLVAAMRGGGYGSVATITDFVLMRFNPDLSVDTTFGTNGTAITDFGTGLEQANGIALDPNGKITVSGGSASSNDTGNFYAARYNPNGSLDTVFGAGGKVTSLSSESPYAGEGQRIVRQPDGKYISAFGARYGEIGAIRLLPNGAIDSSFSYGGVANYQDDRHYPSIGGQGTFILLQSDGKIILPINAGGIKLLRLTNYARNDRADFDDDGKADFSVVRSANGNLTWYELLSANNQFTGVNFGATSDKVASADFDGDSKTDIAVFRPSNGTWYISQSKLGFKGVAFGQSGDIPVPADFDGDGKADIGVFRPSNGTWYYLRSSDNDFQAVPFGTSGDVPVRGDFDRDGKADLAVFRPASGSWYILQSSDNGFRGIQFGQNGDVPIAADFDGDAGADIAIFRPSNGTWYYLRSSDGAFVSVQFGVNGDVPVAGDYDGDGKTDEAVFRNGNWYVLRSLNNSFAGIAFGVSSDTPVPSNNLP